MEAVSESERETLVVCPVGLSEVDVCNKWDTSPNAISPVPQALTDRYLQWFVFPVRCFAFGILARLLRGGLPLVDAVFPLASHCILVSGLLLFFRNQVAGAID